MFGLLVIVALVIIFIWGWTCPAEARSEVEIFLNRIKPYDIYIEQAASERTIDSDLIRAVIWQESSGWVDPPHLGTEKGLMGLTLPAAQDMGYQGTEEGLLDPWTNIKYGTAYLRYQINRYGGNVTKGLVAYNAGYWTGITTFAQKVWVKHAKIKNAKLVS